MRLDVPAGLCVSRESGLLHYLIGHLVYFSSVLSRLVNSDSNDKMGQLEILPSSNIYLAGLVLDDCCLTGRRDPLSFADQ